MTSNKNKSSLLTEKLPDILDTSFSCKGWELISLNGSPITIMGDFDCSDNNLTNLVGGPEKVEGFMDVSFNRLTTLLGFPKFIGNDFWCRDNQELKDISDIWPSEINELNMEINDNMALLPAIKFKSKFYGGPGIINVIFKKHHGSLKQNIIDCQYELVDNGLGEFARWTPE